MFISVKVCNSLPHENVNLGNYTSWLVTWRFYVTPEEPEISTDIHNVTILFYVILRRKSSEWLESSIESD